MPSVRLETKMQILTETATQAPGAAALKIGGKVLARNTLLNIVGQVIPLLVGVATMPYVIHHLGPDRFGLLSFAWIVAGYLGIFDLGIGPATTKFVAELLGKGEHEKLPPLVWTALTTQSGMGLVAGLVLAAASPALVNHLLKVPPELRPDAHWVFLILAVSFPINFAGGSLRGVLAAFQRFDLLNAIGVPTTALWYLIPAGALALRFDLRGIVLLLVISRAMALGAHLFFCLRLCPALRGGWTFKRSLVRSLLGYGGWITLSSTIVPILVYFERFLIGALVSVAAVGYYTPPYMIATPISDTPRKPHGQPFSGLQRFGRARRRRVDRNALLRSLKYLLLIVGPVALMLIFFARRVLTLWVGAKFAGEGALVLEILAAGVLINSLAYVPCSLLQGIGRPDVIAKLQRLQLPFHIGLSWFLVSRFGLPGAALAWSVRLTLEFVMYIVATCWITRTPARLLGGRDLRRTAAALAALAVGLSVLWASTHVFVIDAVFTLLLGGAFLLAAWHYVLDREEKWQIRLWLKVAP